MTAERLDRCPPRTAASCQDGALTSTPPGIHAPAMRRARSCRAPAAGIPTPPVRVASLARFGRGAPARESDRSGNASVAPACSCGFASAAREPPLQPLLEHGLGDANTRVLAVELDCF